MIVKKTESFAEERKSVSKGQAQSKVRDQSKGSSKSPERKKAEPKKIAFGSAYTPKDETNTRSKSQTK